MSTRPPLVQVIENSTGQVRCTFKSIPEIMLLEIFEDKATLSGVEGGPGWPFTVFGLPPCLCCLCHRTVIHQLAYALTLDFPLLTRLQSKFSFLFSLCL